MSSLLRWSLYVYSPMSLHMSILSSRAAAYEYLPMSTFRWFFLWVSPACEQFVMNTFLWVSSDEWFYEYPLSMSSFLWVYMGIFPWVFLWVSSLYEQLRASIFIWVCFTESFYEYPCCMNSFLRVSFCEYVPMSLSMNRCFHDLFSEYLSMSTFRSVFSMSILFPWAAFMSIFLCVSSDGSFYEYPLSMSSFVWVYFHEYLPMSHSMRTPFLWAAFFASTFLWVSTYGSLYEYPRSRSSILCIF